MSPDAWRNYTLQCKPDIVVALSDAVQLQGPQSQKRLTKSIERSTAWLANLLAPVDPSVSSELQTHHPLNVFVNMAGGAEPRAREAFSHALVEQLFGKDLQQVEPLKTLDEGIAGYVFELKTVRPESTERSLPLDVDRVGDFKDGTSSDQLAQLMKASLGPLPLGKPRIAYSSISPHEVLQLVRDVGIDLFDAHWAQRAADIGVALDFCFPVTQKNEQSADKQSCPLPLRRSNGKYDLGHNLFSTKYASDHTRLASSLLDSASATQNNSHEALVCPCAACSPVPPSSHIVHSDYENQNHTFNASVETKESPYMRSYIHHLLHTHEMSSHSLLMMHNLSAMDAFFTGIRHILAQPTAAQSFSDEVELFCATYNEPMELFREADMEWARVESERGKGRLAREKEKSVQTTASGGGLL